MPITHRHSFRLAPLYALLLVTPAHAQDAKWSKPLDEERRVVHLLNRLSFGPRPGDVQRVRQSGVRSWLDSQFKPQSVADSGVDTEAARFKTLRLEPRVLALAYAGDTAQIAKVLRDRKQAAGEMGAMPAQLTAAQQRLYDEMQAENLDPGTSQQALGELVADKLLRAVESERQLQEVLVDFWSNHFNVDVKKGPVRAYKVVDERETIRPHVFSNFRRLLGASAKSPAMLWYLDNARSTREMVQRNGKKRGGLNENYARELMELHTLGVDGGYSQADVQEVARCFTGWSLGRNTGLFEFRPRMHDDEEKTVLNTKIPAGGGQDDGERVLDLLVSHPSTAKFIARKLCLRFVSDTPPATLVDKVAATFTRTKGDLPATYRTIFESPEFWSEGAYKSKIKSPFEFAVSSVRALGGTYYAFDAEKPQERARLVNIGGASLGRGGARRVNRPLLAVEISQMGQPLYSCVPPTGYSEISSNWVSSSALVARLNFALALTGGRIGDVELQRTTMQPGSVDEVARQILMAPPAPATKATLEKEMAANPDAARMRALILGSPEFQRR